ncbi:amino acid ABC transporter permease [Bradyrhizobium prioriisuperbiae]|uniref:amino acid ABC transporter permease n=1 Tax=Bradyrhizobium prioriisuperbiae TaxID=2854389 RepID=UPI0028EB6F08|nr:amino acid ABC transporter permease [Bradyrhizobium prioritasuperba]
MDRILEYYFNPKVLALAFPDVLAGFRVTVVVSLLIIVFGIALGLSLALLRCANFKALNAAIVAYVDVLRTLPQLVVIVFIYFGLPYLGVTLSPFVTTVLSLAMVLSAFSTEIFWSAIMAVPRGQWDAASALGFSRARTLLQIILPQAIRLAVPLLTNRAISISKGTALGTAVSLPETLGQAQSVTAIVANPSPLTLAAAFYLTFFLPLVIASRWIERSHSRRR